MGLRTRQFAGGLSWCRGEEAAPDLLPMLLDVVVGLLRVQTRFILRPLAPNDPHVFRSSSSYQPPLTIHLTECAQLRRNAVGFITF